MSVDWDVVVVHWTSWAVLCDVLEVFNQIFFGDWTEEKVWQDKNGRDANLLGMLGQFIDISDGCAADLDHADQIVLAANLPPFLGDAFAFIDAEGGAFTHCAIDQNTLDSLLLQPASVLVDDIVVDGFPAAKRFEKL